MPTSKYLKQDRSLRVSGHLITQLNKKDDNTGKSYFELARNRGARIRKFARWPKSLNKWRAILNESSHFSTKFRKIDKNDLMSFINMASDLFDSKDKYLILGALNEIFSKGRVKALLMNDEDNSPGICSHNCWG